MVRAGAFAYEVMTGSFEVSLLLMMTFLAWFVSPVAGHGRSVGAGDDGLAADAALG
jgi:hypothetical protein